MELSEFAIMIADDNQSLLKIYEKSLSAEGYRLILIENNENALPELAKTPIDLLIIDHGALTILPFIERDYPKLPVIVVSGSYDSLMENRPDQKGSGNVKRFFIKPLSMDILKKNIKEVLKIED